MTGERDLRVLLTSMQPLLHDGNVVFCSVKRDPAAGNAALHALVSHENLDRGILYAASALEVGHGSNDWFGDWMPFERASFAREWVAQAPAGWWHRNDKGEWVRKASGPVSADAAAK